MGFWSDPLGSGAGSGKKEAGVSKTNWRDMGNARNNAEAKNEKAAFKKQAKKDAKKAKKKGFWS